MTENWWSKGNEPSSPGGDENHVGDIGQGWRDGMGILGNTIGVTGMYTFMLTSVASARNFHLAEDPEVEIDIVVVTILSIITSVIVGYYMRSNLAIGWGIALTVIFDIIYLIRGGFVKLPVHVPLITPKLT